MGFLGAAGGAGGSAAGGAAASSGAAAGAGTAAGTAAAAEGAAAAGALGAAEGAAAAGATDAAVAGAAEGAAQGAASGAELGTAGGDIAGSAVMPEMPGASTGMTQPVSTPSSTSAPADASSANLTDTMNKIQQYRPKGGGGAPNTQVPQFTPQQVMMPGGGGMGQFQQLTDYLSNLQKR